MPWAIIFPCCRKIIRCDISSISCMLCEVYSILNPDVSRYSFKNPLILYAISGSRLAVGSSRNRILGSVITALARVSRVIWPDDNLRVSLWRTSSISSFFTISSMRLVTSGVPYNLPVTRRFSSTVNEYGIEIYVDEKLTCRRMVSRCFIRSRPNISIVPCVGVITPKSI